MGGAYENMETLLREHYRSQRANDAASVDYDRAVDAVLEQAASAMPASSRTNSAAFVMGQVRFVPKSVWLSVAAIAAPTVLFAVSGLLEPTCRVWLSAAGSLLALPCLWMVVASKSYGMMELEQGCLFNAASVLFARMILAGAAAFGALAACCAACTAYGTFAMALSCAALPYFLASAGGLLLVRKASSADALPLAFAWTGAVCAVTCLAHVWPPAIALNVPEVALAAGTLAAAAWFAREAVAWSRAVRESGGFGGGTVASGRA